MLAAIVPVCRSSLEMGRRAGAMALARRSCRITQLLWKIGEFGKETLQESELHVGIRNQSDETAGVLCQRSGMNGLETVSYTHLRAHETRHDLVCRLLLEKKKKKKKKNINQILKKI